jgi:hypothetical protein
MSILIYAASLFLFLSVISYFIYRIVKSIERDDINEAIARVQRLKNKRASIPLNDA